MKSKKTQKYEGSAKEYPQSLDEIMREAPRMGERDWHNKRRRAYPRPGQVKPAGWVALSMGLLKKREERSLASMTPPEASVEPFAPRPAVRKKQRKLRRFSGKKVTPAAACEVFIYNGDDRRIYQDTSYPWVCIGRIFMPDGTAGSAAVIGRTFILTAAHAVADFWRANEPVKPGIRFVPAYFDGSSLLGPEFTANIIGVAAWEEGVKGDVVGYDMAICQLDQPMGEWLGYFGCQSYRDDWEDRAVWAHAGYACDLGDQRPCYELGIVVKDDDSDSHNTLEIETDADIAKGQSGGPLWGVFNGDHRVIGTLSGHEDMFAEPTSNVFAGGNGLVQLVRWGRTNWG